MLAGGNAIQAKDIPKTDSLPKADVKLEESVVPKELRPKTTEEIVKEYFKDTPILAKIAYCESRYRQFDKDGSIFRGIVDNDDIGVMQINARYHLEKAKSLGMDIFTVEGNLAYGKYLYEKQGSVPWNASSPCWGNKVAMK